MSSDHEQSVLEAPSDDEDDWEEVDVPEHLSQPQHEKHIEITLQTRPSKSKNNEDEAAKKRGISHAERLLRIDLHKIHTVALLANAKVRNEWINDELLHARLLSLTPLTLQNEFALIHKSRIPDQAQRGRAFERAMQHMAEWWAHSFFEVLPEGHLRNRTFDEIQRKLGTYGLLEPQPEDDIEPIDPEIVEAILGGEQERIRGSKSLMKHALMRCGSRDVSSQLFTALCRALGIPARLVVSLQSVPWKSSIGKPKPKYDRKSAKGKGKAKAVENADVEEEPPRDVKGKGKAPAFQGTGQRLDGTSVPKSEKAKGKEKAKPVIKLRKQRDKGHRLGDPTPGPSRLVSPDPTTTPPVFWTEVFSRPDGRWLPVDPIRAIVNKRKVFDPTPLTNTPGTATPSAPSNSLSIAFPHVTKKSNVPRGFKEENRMLYVMAFEEDGYARDVTRRYAREYSAKVAKAQGGSAAVGMGGGGKARQAWWEKVVGLVKRPYQLQRDDVEDEELAAAQMMEGMPTTIGGFKDHPLYVLERHLKQTEVIHPPPPDTPELGKFRGEPVYPRSSVIPLKTAETWMRTEGRVIKPGGQPLKTIKARPGTINRQRELEVLKDELRDAGFGEGSSASEVMQGLYAFSQTELYVPPPIVDGKIPKNNFGNIDLYVPSMLPKGAVHVPFKGTAKIARKLGFDFAEAVTGFEFKKRRAHPVVAGVVVAAENESALLEAFYEAQKLEEEKARAKKEEKAMQHWVKLVQGLRIRQRLKEQYADRAGSSPHPKSVGKAGSSANKTKAKGTKGEDMDVDAYETHDTADDRDVEGANEKPAGGGFLVEADDVVQAFHLPKYNPVLLLDSASSNPFAKHLQAGGSGMAPGKGIGSSGGKDGHRSRGSAATGDTRRRDGREGDDEDGQEHERRVIDYVTYDLDEDEGGVESMEVDRGEGWQTSVPPMTDHSHSSPLSFAELEGDGDEEGDGRQGNEGGDGEEDDTAPRTMEDLLRAEEDARLKAEVRDNLGPDVRDGINDMLELVATSTQLTGPSNVNPSASASGSEGGVGRVGSSGPGPALLPNAEDRGESTGDGGGKQLRSGRNRNGATKAKVVPTPPRGIANGARKGQGQKRKKVVSKKSPAKGANKRKRGKRMEEEEEEEEIELVDIEDDVGDNEDEEDDSPRSRKRPRAAVSTETPSAGTGRTLRPRRSKTAAQLEEEREAERAFKRAVAQ